MFFSFFLPVKDQVALAKRPNRLWKSILPFGALLLFTGLNTLASSPDPDESSDAGESEHQTHASNVERVKKQIGATVSAQLQIANSVRAGATLRGATPHSVRLPVAPNQTTHDIALTPDEMAQVTEETNSKESKRHSHALKKHYKKDQTHPTRTAPSIPITPILPRLQPAKDSAVVDQEKSPRNQGTPAHPEVSKHTQGYGDEKTHSAPEDYEEKGDRREFHTVLSCTTPLPESNPHTEGLSVIVWKDTKNGPLSHSTFTAEVFPFRNHAGSPPYSYDYSNLVYYSDERRVVISDGKTFQISVYQDQNRRVHAQVKGINSLGQNYSAPDLICPFFRI